MPMRAVVFDVYGTLLDVQSVEDACRAVTAAPAALVTLWRQKQLEYTWLRAVMGRYEDFWTVSGEALDYAAARIGLVLDPATRDRLLRSWLGVRPFPDVLPALDRLGTWSLAVLSNGTPAMLEAALTAAGVRHRLSVVLSVDAVRTYKPSPAVYRMAEEHLRLPREAILFVSANGWDVAGAKAVGLPTAWVNRLGAPGERLGVLPDLVVGNLEELADRLTG